MKQGTPPLIIAAASLFTVVVFGATFIPVTNPTSVYVPANPAAPAQEFTLAGKSYFEQPSPWIVLNETLFVKKETIRRSVLAPIVSEGLTSQRDISNLLAHNPELKKYCSASSMSRP